MMMLLAATRREEVRKNSGYVFVALALCWPGMAASQTALPKPQPPSRGVAAVVADPTAGTALSPRRLQLNVDIERARAEGDSLALAAALNRRGVLAAARGQTQTAVDDFAASVAAARRHGDTLAAARALLNAARLDPAAEDRQRLLSAGRDLAAAPDGVEKAFLLTALGELWRRRLNGADAARDALNQAAALAERFGDRRTLAYAWGTLAALYEDQRRFADALSLTRRAVFAAQQAPDSLYRWQWQLGRLLAAVGEREAAISAYRAAAFTLEPIRSALSARQRRQGRSLERAVKPLYFGLADLLLRHAPTVGDPQRRTELLAAARGAVESFKSAELTDYFQDDCVAALQARTRSLEDAVVAPDTAVLYPVLLADRTELLLGRDGGLRQLSVAVDNATLTRRARRFRERLERFDVDGYLADAQQLYRWLIEPLALNGAIKTLVVVPDGALRAVPFAALHDGERFLVERVAVAVTPGLSLTDFRPSTALRRGRVLLSGLTEAVQDFPPLPNVAAELDAVAAQYRATVLKDQTYLLSRLRRELNETPYAIVHIASHGQFGASAADSFLLTYDDKLTLDGLERLLSVGRYRSRPVELLTLSACQTALGDDRAALGLAGAAVKSGARSVLASLWLIEDRATAALVSDFYRRLQNPALSKAEALRRAQLTLIREPVEPEFRHPSFWAPFLLIGNWL